MAVLGGITQVDAGDSRKPSVVGENLVGRELVTATSETALAAALAGEGVVWHVTGEPGAGKTSLLAALQEKLERAGVAVLRSEADEIDRRRSLSVFQTLLRVSREVVSQADDPVSLILSTIEYRTMNGPLAVLVDDLHWADSDSIDGLAAIARRVDALGLLLVTAARPPQAGSSLHRYQVAVEKRGGTLTVLEGLNDRELDELVSRRTGSHAGPRLRWLLRGTAGNPFFAVELLRAVEDEGSLRLEGGLVDVATSIVPSELKVRLGQAALAAAGEDTMLLRAAAAVPGGFTIEELAALLERPLIAVVEEVLRLKEAFVVEERGARLTFRHEIIRQSVVEATPVSVVRALNRRALACLDQLGRHDELRSADFLLACADPANPSDRDALIELGLQLATTQPLAAIDLLKPALAHLASDDEATVRVIAACGWALVDAGRPHDVGPLLDAHPVGCRPGVRELDQLRNHALLLQGDVAAALDRSPAIDGHDGLADRDIRTREDIDGVAELALFSVIGGRVDQSRRLLRSAERAPVDAGPVSHALLEHARAWLLGIDGYLEDALHAAETSLSLLEAEPGPEAERGRPYVVAAIMQDALGQSDKALALVREKAATVNPPWNRSILHFASALLLFRRAEWDDAQTEVAAGLLLAEEMDLRLGIVWPYALSAIMAAVRGDLASAHHWLTRSRSEVAPRSMGGELLGYSAAVLAEASGDTLGAAEISGATIDAALETGAPGLLLNLGTDAQRLAVAAGHSSRADRLVCEFRVLSSRTQSPVVHALTRWVAGLREQDGSAIADAGGVLRVHGRTWEAARAHHDAAVLMAERGNQDDARQAALSALQTYEPLGAELIQARLRAELRTHGMILQPRRGAAKPLTGWESLTPTERRITDLVASGLSNNEVAEQLFVSRRTVESHLARVYPKLGIRRRVELVMGRRSLSAAD